jgi:two-component system, OmpR family, sensor histidine kinase KdpD
MPAPLPRLGRHAAAVAAVTIATGLGLVSFRYLALAEITMLYLIAIALASLGGRGPALVAASLAVLAFDVCFVPPRFTLGVADASHLLTFAVMFGAGLAISTLTVRLREQERDAVLRERDTAALLAFTQKIAAATTRKQIAEVTAHHASHACGGDSTILLLGGAGDALEHATGPLMTRDEESAARRALELDGDPREPAGRGALALALVVGDAKAGVLVVRPRHGGELQISLLEAFARQAALALARIQSLEHAREAALRAHTEELRGNLLAAVSHDLRTPLAVITSAATTLRDDPERLSRAARDELLSSIVDDARRLERVLGNLLQLTRVESGMVPNRESVPLEEIVGGALTRLEDAIGDREVALAIPNDLVISVDPVLFEQAVINMIDNALKHGAPPIEVSASQRVDHVELAIRDHGPGLGGVEPERLFERFVRESSAPGAGIGLTVVRAIVEAHGGTVSAGGDREGALFRIELPQPAVTS